MTKELILSGGAIAIVDDDVFEWASKYKWSAKRNRHSIYARRNTARPEKRSVILHRVIMNAPPGIQVDHINGNGLDCRRSNMRLATIAENLRNRGPQANNTSGYKGVRWNKHARKWVATIQLRGKRIHLGYHTTAEAAARAYDAAALKHHGAFARLNFEELQP